MQVILTEKVENLGVLGDSVSVKPGYARNYLVPYGKAVQATIENVAAFEKQKVELEKAETKRLEEAKEKAEKLSNQVFTIKAQAGEGGKLFGSVGAKEVAEVLLATASVEVEKRHVRIPDGTIRHVGEFQLFVHLYAEVEVAIQLVVAAQ